LALLSLRGQLSLLLQLSLLSLPRQLSLLLQLSLLSLPRQLSPWLLLSSPLLWSDPLLSPLGSRWAGFVTGRCWLLGDGPALLSGGCGRWVGGLLGSVGGLGGVGWWGGGGVPLWGGVGLVARWARVGTVAGRVRVVAGRSAARRTGLTGWAGRGQTCRRARAERGVGGRRNRRGHVEHRHGRARGWSDGSDQRDQKRGRGPADGGGHRGEPPVAARGLAVSPPPNATPVRLTFGKKSSNRRSAASLPVLDSARGTARRPLPWPGQQCRGHGRRPARHPCPRARPGAARLRPVRPPLRGHPFPAARAVPLLGRRLA